MPKTNHSLKNGIEIVKIKTELAHIKKELTSIKDEQKNCLHTLIWVKVV